MEYKDRNEITGKIGGRSRYSLFTRVIAMILVICLTFTMTGCTTSDGQSMTLLGALLGIVRGLLLGFGGLIIAGIAWVLEQATCWQNQWTGWCMCGVSAFLFKGWAKLVDPTDTFVDWSEMGKSDISFHDEHIEKPDWDNKDEESSAESEEGKLLANPGEGEILITYDANGGYYAPEDEVAKIGSKHKISDKIPVRPGYHFMGWAYDYEKSEGQFVTSKEFEIGADGKAVVTDKTQELQDEVKYYPGKKTDEKLMGNTALKAIWKSHDDMIMDLRAGSKEGVHGFDIKREGKSPYVTIKCKDCGMRYSDPCVEIAEFKLMYGSGLFKTKKKMTRLYNLYRAQNIGPLALRFNTMYYNADVDELDQIVNSAISVAENVKEPMKKISSTAEKYAKKANTAGKNKDAITEYFNKTYSQEKLKWAENFFNDISDGTEKAGMAIDTFKSAYALQKMFNKNVGVLEQTEGMLEFVECISSFAGVDDLVSPVADTLKEGLTLIGKMEKSITYQESIVDGILWKNHTGESAYLDYFLGQKYPFHDYLDVLKYQHGEGSRYGCGCKDDPSKCPFKNNKFDDGATVHEILEKMAGSPNPSPIDGQKEKEALIFYLAERSEHELYMLTGLTLEEYAKLVK